MSETPRPHQIRVFLSSPGDVAEERILARRLLKEELPYKPFLRGRITFDVVSWDDPAAPTPMDAGITPQTAVNRFRLKPSECDVVVVVLWSRLGTNLSSEEFRKRDGRPYLSGTEWEFDDALRAQPRPVLLLYRRTEKPKAELGDPTLLERLRQFNLVEEFFGRLKNPDGSLVGGFTPYATPTEFKDLLESHLQELLHERLRDSPGHSLSKPPAAPTWIGSPY
jgi:hypothetical protein